MKKYRKFSEWQKDVAGIPPNAPKTPKVIGQHEVGTLGTLGTLDEGTSEKISFQDAVDEYEERAGIMQFDGGMSRADAEAAALKTCKTSLLEHLNVEKSGK